MYEYHKSKKKKEGFVSSSLDLDNNHPTKRPSCMCTESLRSSTKAHEYYQQYKSPFG